jgi:mono/diheme cytochrome c family protein
MLRALAASLVFVTSLAMAQSDKPGPMQSGSHVKPETGGSPAGNAAATPQGAPSGEFDVPKLFATSCGWCHLDGGRKAGKGPQLMGTTLNDAQIVSRIVNGKTGAMPAFGTTFTGEQMKAIVDYIRGLKQS